MGELKDIALQHQPEEAQPDLKRKLIIAGCMVVLLFLTYQLVLGRFELVPIIGEIRDRILGSVNSIIYFFSKIVRGILSIF